MTKKGPAIEGVTKELLEQIYLQNPEANMEDVGQMFGVHHQTVSRWLKRFGLKSKGKARPGQARLSEAKQLQDKEWLTQQMEIKPQKQIAEELGIYPAVVSYWAGKHGLADESKSVAVKRGLSLKYPEGRFGEEAARWKGGRRQTKSGYIELYAPDHPYARHGVVFEHRLVIEEHLGRYLEPDEIVDHIDGNKSNNAIENLSLTTRHAHMTRHFDDSHKVHGLEQENAELRQENIELKQRIAVLEAELAAYKV